MEQRPAIARALNHAAYQTTDTAATCRFYTEVMGFKLVAAVRGEADPSTGTDRPFLHTFFAMRSGEVLAFFDLDGVEPPPPDHLPPWVRHIALSVDSQDELLAWRKHLKQHGIEVTPVVDHDGVWKSIYFHDPNKVLLELTYQARALDQNDAASAERMVAEWTAARAPSAKAAG